jgi:hypothetical protein
VLTELRAANPKRICHFAPPSSVNRFVIVGCHPTQLAQRTQPQYALVFNLDSTCTLSFATEEYAHASITTFLDAFYTM